MTEEIILKIARSVGRIIARLYFLFCIIRYYRHGKQPSKIEMLCMIMLSV